MLGFRVGADSTLADWEQIGAYFARLAATSPRVRVDTLGATTQHRPYLLVTISDSANLARRAELMAAQRSLADPRTLQGAAEGPLIASQPAVVLISCSIHSTEIAASQMAMELAWRLVTDSAEAALLKHVVVLLVPSANPDGIDIVTDWYRRTRGTPYDGTSPPWLFHPYIGHDDNRDWFMLTQPETQYLTRVLYRDWFPEVVYDIHQMGGTGARMFVPPFADPVNPNLDGILVAATNEVGTVMAGALADSGYTGVAHQIDFDLWWHGGNRTVPARHNMIGILTEAASARIASPVRLAPSALRQPDRGVNYPAPWAGGWWHLRDIVDYELVTSEALIRFASREHAAFVSRFVNLGRRAVEAGRTGQPAAYAIAPGQRDEGARAQFANLLIADGVEIRRARAPFAAGGREYPAGTLVIPLAQPFRAHVKDLVERQHYPARHEYPGGPALPPYDVTGWTLPLVMGVTVDSLGSPVEGDFERVDTVAVTPGHIAGAGSVVLLENRSNGEATAVWRALAAAGGASVAIAPAPFEAGGRRWPTGTLAVRGKSARAVLDSAARALGFDGVAVPHLDAWPGAPTVTHQPRVALYRSWNANMDEGWTRWVLERLGVPYTTLTDSAVRAGGLASQFDVVLLPSESPSAIRDGRRAGTAPPQYSGGLGQEGATALRAFLEAGGTLIALGEATAYAVTDLGVPGSVAGAARRGAQPPDLSRFSAPGSIFEAEVDRGHPIASGMDSVTAVYFISTPILNAAPGDRVVAAYPRDRNPLLSGYVEGVEALEGHPALLEAPVAGGRGSAILFAFRPQHRGQTNATFKLLTNAILYGAASAPARPH
ncbi:MAG TPA: M14 family metallopeptidase [Gemmatimonadales bacterium]|nr:M14 family metallopeptidase [Gemmatimonadales bacterium]